LNVIYDWPSFVLAGLLGLVQAAVAVYGGHLSALTLPDDKRKRHQVQFILLGVLLFVLTTSIGYLNDRNQSQANSNVLEARLSEKAVQGKLDISNGTLSKIDGYVQLAVMQLPQDRNQATSNVAIRAIAKLTAGESPLPTKPAASPTVNANLELASETTAISTDMQKSMQQAQDKYERHVLDDLEGQKQAAIKRGMPEDSARNAFRIPAGPGYPGMLRSLRASAASDFGPRIRALLAQTDNLPIADQLSYKQARQNVQSVCFGFSMQRDSCYGTLDNLAKVLAK
jgi:hypothetical protein